MSADGLVASDQYREILEQLTPGQLFVVALRLDQGMTNGEIAEEIGISTQGVSNRFDGAAKRVADAFPDLAYEVKRPYQRRRHDVLNEKEQQFIQALQKMEARGIELTTSITVAREAGLHRATANQISHRLREMGLVVAGARTRRGLPLRLAE